MSYGFPKKRTNKFGRCSRHMTPPISYNPMLCAPEGGQHQEGHSGVVAEGRPRHQVGPAAQLHRGSAEAGDRSGEEPTGHRLPCTRFQWE